MIPEETQKLKVFLKKFKDIRKENKIPIQTKFDLDLNIKKKVDKSKIGYQVKEINKYQRFEKIDET